MDKNYNSIKIGIVLMLFVIKTSAQTVKGIDVSDYQGTINWTSVKNAGITFAFAKATEGITVTDSQFSNYMTNGEAADVYMGAYHFAHPDNNSTISGAISEANHFLSVAQSYIKTCQMPPVLDYELDVSSSMSWSVQAQWVEAWCNTVQNATGIVPIIYSGNVF